MRLKLLFVALSCITLPLFAAPSAELDVYRVRLDVYEGEDAGAIARRVASTYGGQLVATSDDADAEGAFDVRISRSAAQLLARDPRVSALEPVANLASAWTTGTYVYDGSGNIEAMGERKFTYDESSRLTEDKSGAAEYQQYSYDSFGNIVKVKTSEWVNGGQVTTESRPAVNPTTNKIDNSTQPAGQPAFNVVGIYDLAGNITSLNASSRFAYDGLNVVKEATVDGVRRVFLYTASDERIASLTMSGSSVASEQWTLRDTSGKVLRRASRTGSGALTWQEDYIYRGTQLLAAEVTGPEKVRQFHPDHLGTPRLITGNGGVAIAQPRYFAFGQEVRESADHTEALKFTGHERDARSLDYMHARYYDPLVGRFLSVDPGAADLRQPQTWNRYAYATNDPIGNNDPDGRLTNPVTYETGRGRPILHRGGGFGEIRKKVPGLKASASGEFEAPRGKRIHRGVDIVAPKGHPVAAAFSGEVSEIRENDVSLGKSVFVLGKNGIIAIYSHLDTVDVREGQRVGEAEAVGTAGLTGNVDPDQPHTEDHLHFQLYDEDGELTDPEEFLNDPAKQREYCDPEFCG